MTNWKLLLQILVLALGTTLGSCSSDDLEDPSVPETEEPDNGGDDMDDEDDDDNDSDDDNDDNNDDDGDFDDSDYPEAPAFSAETTDGTLLSLNDYEDKNLVIFFFGSGCPPCMAIAPSIEEEIHQKYAEFEDFAIIGLDEWDGSNNNVNNFESNTGVTFNLGTRASSIAHDFNTTYDRLVVVSKNGKIIFNENSVASNTKDEVIDLLDQVLN